MNRIKIGPQGTSTQSLDPKPLPITPYADPLPDFNLDQLSGDAFHEDRAIFIPFHYEKNYSYPLIVWLHDEGQNENRLSDVMFDICTQNYLAVAPRGPESGWRGGYSWRQSRDTVFQSHRSVIAAIDEACCRFNVNSSRIYLAGAGSGGTMAFRLALREPELFAGVISLNGQFPQNLEPLARLGSCRKMPVLWSHARHSSVFSETQLCQQLRLLHVSGFSVTLRQYPCDDQLMPQAMNDVNIWIMDAINDTDELMSRGE